MNSYYNAVAGYYNGQNAEASSSQPNTAHQTGDASIDVAAPLLQVLQPPIPWNWPTVATGQIPAQQFQFCDSIPQDINSSSYAASSRSFSIGYSGFLNLINIKMFPLAPALTQNIIENTIPVSGTPGNGWVQVLNNAGQLEWRKMWNISQNPHDWLAAASAGLVGAPASFAFDDPGMTVTVNGKKIPFAPQTGITINAASVGRIQVSPGDWYNSSLVTVAQCNSSYLSVPANIIFGNPGLINCRVAEFIVALKPVPSITCNKALFDAMNIAAADITAIDLAGFTFSSGGGIQAKGGTVIGNASFSVSPSGTGTVELTASLIGADKDNVFIVAVILEANNNTQVQQQ